MIEQLRRLAFVATGAIAGCALQPSPDGSVAGGCAPGGCPACPVCPAQPAVLPRANPLEQVDFSALTGWKDGEQAAAWNALLASCRALRWREAWRGVCARAMELRSPSDEEARRFLEGHFVPWRLANPDGVLEGVITGYYEPLLRGSRTRAAPYLYPLYGPPDDLLTIDLATVSPELRGLRLRGRVELDSGETLRLGYADQNGHPFQSIGRHLVERGELKLEEASMQSIKSWAAANPQRLEELLNQNPSFVFFRELPLADPAGGPVGALGVPLAAGRSIAVDPRYIPLGAPVFLATTHPASATPLTRLVVAQDTGGAIRSPVRADFFWGSGAEAGAQAGRMRQPGRMWVLLPKDLKPNPAGVVAP